VVATQRQALLLHVVLTLRSAYRTPDLLHGRQEQGNEKGDDGNNGQQFDQRERAANGIPEA
jgi:hypothetical protein